MNELTPAQLMRYNRQIVLPGFDIDGQETLAASRALIVGAGGLGCAAAQYLVAAGIGALTLVDDDKVDVSNLQRQVLHTQDSVGEYKVTSAKLRLQALNPDCQIQALPRRLDEAELAKEVEHHHIVLDCTDNLASRELTNALCVKHKIPLVSGAAIRMEGQVLVVDPNSDGPCYQCVSRLFGEQQLSCTEAGVMGPLVGIIGATQALEAIKVLCQWGQNLSGRLLLLDAARMKWQELGVAKYSQCPVCG